MTSVFVMRWRATRSLIQSVDTQIRIPQKALSISARRIASKLEPGTRSSLAPGKKFCEALLHITNRSSGSNSIRLAGMHSIASRKRLYSKATRCSASIKAVASLTAPQYPQKIALRVHAAACR